LDAAARFIARIKDDGLRKVYSYNLDRWLGLNDQELVLARIGQHMRGGRRQAQGAAAQPGGRGAAQAAPSPAADRPHAPEEPRYDPGDPVIQVEREALKLAIQRPALCGPAFDAIEPAAFTAPRHAVIRNLIADCGGT